MIKVKLRKKPISNGRTSLYLDYYPAIPHPDTGKSTRREFLGLYMFNRPKTVADKEQNSETLALAENIRARRQIDSMNGAYGFLSKKSLKTCFVRYCESMASTRNGSTKAGWRSFMLYLRDFTGGTLLVSDLTVKKCRDFRTYMIQAPSQRNGKPLAANSVVSYFNKFKAALKQAFKDELISTDLNAKVDCIEGEDTQRGFLNLEELQTLLETDLPAFPVLRQAALFSALTGLRYSDIENLIWENVRYDSRSGYSLYFKQQKTKDYEVLPIPEQAIMILGTLSEDSHRVFPGLKYSTHWNNILKQWIREAGIRRLITFHSFRHTYATLQLTYGTDLYTVSKMMGHRSIKPTEIYAKIVDKLKQDAANRIKLNL